MTTNIDFVNRASELKAILDMVNDPHQFSRAIFFYGAGGLGKTRLLQEIPHYLQSRKVDIIHTDIIDFDDLALRVVDNLVHILLERLPKISQEDIDNIYHELKLLRHMERVGDSQKTQNEQGLRIIRHVAQTVNNVSKWHSPVMLRFDTIEKIDSEVQASIIQFMIQLRGAFVVFSGRLESGAEAFWRELNKIESAKNKLRSIELEPFDTGARKEYLKKKERDRHVRLSPQDADLLINLSKGRPILIDLAVEYYARSPEVNFNYQSTPKQAQTKRDTDLFDREHHDELARAEEFEHKLVNYVTAVRSDMERLILVLSRVYPLSVKMVTHMLNLSEKEANELCDEAQSYVFIKTIVEHDGSVKITLHDEMRRMVNTHVWNEVDPSYRRRIRDSRRAWGMFAQEDDALRNIINSLKSKLKEPHDAETYSQYLTLRRKREIITEDRLRHALFADFDAGFAEWQELIDKIRFGRKYSFISRLRKLAQPYIEQKIRDSQIPIPQGVKPTEQQKFEYYFIEARANQDLGNFVEAEKRYLSLLDRAETTKNTERQRQIANMLGVLKRDQGQKEEALEYQKRCRSLLPDDHYWAVANVENQLGYLFRLLKDKNFNYIDPAREHYEYAIEAAYKAIKETSDPEKKVQTLSLIAAINNNLGYIYSLNKEFDRAEVHCKQAINIWDRINRTREIAWAKINLGVMARDQRQYQHAEQRLNEAIALLIDPDDFRDLCQAYLQLGWTQWFMAEINSDRESRVVKLKEARRNLEKSLKYAKDHDFRTELPDVYHQLSSVYWSLSKEEDNDVKKNLQDLARKGNKKAIEWSIRLENNRYFVDAWVGEMEFDYDEGIASNIQKHLDTLEPYKKYNFPLYFGRVERILGDWAYRNENFDTAIEHYRVAIPLINGHGGYGPYKIEIELANLADKLQRLSSTQAKTYLEELGTAWENTSGRINLLYWVKQQKNQVQILD